MEEDFEILLVNARHVKNVPGHKTDKKDSAWLSKLLLSGLLKGSFIPPQDIRELRDLVRYKKKLIGQVSSEKNRIIKVLEDCNIKLSSVLSNVDATTGTKIINAIISGARDVEVLMSFYRGKIKASREDFSKALTGRITPYHIRMLQFHKKRIKDTEALIDEIDYEIEKAAEAYRVEINLLQQSDFFKIKFNDKFGDNPINSQCIDCSYFVKKGTLGTWVFNFDNRTQEYVPVPFYQKPCENSKMITRLKKDDSVVVILDIQENWMYVETITQGKKKRW